MRFAIVAITFNRPVSLSRLLGSLSAAAYDSHAVDLIISIDYSGTSDCRQIAECYRWDYGMKRVIAHPKRLGLRAHVLACGDFLREYDAIAVFEDDIFASPAFFRFARQAAEHYRDSEDVAGISLYAPHWSEYHSRPFTPAKADKDVYFVQYAQSWGQVWLKNQWLEFRRWYDTHSSDDLRDAMLPENVANWPASSWLKYHIKYCIEENKYFVFPYVSLSTNFTDVGHHNDKSNTTYQVPFVCSDKASFVFGDFDDRNERIVYDAFFERQRLGAFLGVPEKDLTVDLYGRKPEALYRRFVLTVRPRDYVVARSFGMKVRPHEMNVILDIPGESIFLYDTSQPEKRDKSRPYIDVDIEHWLFDVKHINYRIIATVLFRKLRSKINPKEAWLSIRHRLTRQYRRRNKRSCPK